MGLITCQHSTSIDGFIAEAHRRSDRLQAWLRAGNDITAQHRHPLPGWRSSRRRSRPTGQAANRRMAS
jgi:hypothetical protein